MSNGLADASFFPTAKELSTGLRWVKDHPVLAAAAATAVSVITFLNAAESLAHSRSSANVLDSDNDIETGNDRSLVADAAATTFHKQDIAVHRRKRDAERAADEQSTAAEIATAVVVNATVAAAAASSTTAAAAAGACSDEKLAAAVSWCDEHGGSLTQVFEHLHVVGDDDDDDSNSNNSDETAAQTTTTRRPPALKKSATLESIQTTAVLHSPHPPQSPPVHNVGSPMLFSPSGVHHHPHGGDADVQTESPQWGWYVAITPPQDQMHASLPRAMVAAAPPQQRSSAASSYRMNAGGGASTFSSATLRRSTSGRIS